MPRKFKSCLTTKAKRNSIPLTLYLTPPLKGYIEYRANAESKTLSQVLISIITKEIANDKFYKKELQ